MLSATYSMPDKESANMLLALKYDLGTDRTKVLFEACMTGDLELVKLLIASDSVDIHVKNDWALLSASYRGQKSVVELLLSQGVYKQEVIQGAVVQASRSSSTDMLNWLLDYEVFANLVSCDKWYTAMLDVLLQMGADVQVFDKQVLKYASIRGYKSLVELLFDKVVDIHRDETVLKDAYANGHKDIVDWVTRRLDEQRMAQLIDMDKQRYSF